MFRNFTIIAWRNLFRHKVFSFVNVIGLSIGMAASLLLLEYVGFEMSYDKFSNSGNVYRIRHDTFKKGILENSGPLTYYGAGPAIKERFPEVLNFVRLHRADGMLNYQKGPAEVVSYHEREAFYADSTFFSMFPFSLIAGEAKNALRNPASVLISQSASRKYFGKDDAIGKIISLTTEWEGGDYVVEGVFKDIPGNSHLQFDFLFSIENLLNNKQFRDGSWYWTNFAVYLELRANTDVATFETKMQSVIDDHLGRQLRKSNSQEKFILQPVEGIHLESKADRKIVSFLLIISFFIVAIGWLNYINLSTAKSTERAREVGMRKIFGSSRVQLVKQFLLESAVLTGLSLFLASIIFLLTKPFFDQLIGKETSFVLASQTTFWLGALGVIVVGTFLSGLYPALVLSSFQPIRSIHGKLIPTPGRISLRKTMVIFQFGTSMLLIVATLTIYRQLAYMRSQDLGLNIHQKLVVRAPKKVQGNSYLNAIGHFKTALTTSSKVLSVSASSEIPGKEIFWTNEFRLTNEPEQVRRLTNLVAVDDDFIPTYEMKFLAGRNFSHDKVHDFGNAVILNESALKLLGATPTSVIGQELIIGEAVKKTIVGVIADFHQQSVQYARKPIILYFIPWTQDYFTLSVSTPNIRETLSDVERIYRAEFPENAFDYFFLDDYFDQQYRSEERSWQVFSLFSALSIFIASLGLFGLSSFVTIQRKKEIAIRKVLGASAAGVTILLTSDFGKLLFVSFVVAAPVSKFLLDDWLQGFPLRVDIPWWSFVLAGLGTFVIAFFTVGFQAVSAALTNPVDAIKNE